MSLLLWILENKLLTTLFLVSGSLFISTIVLGVQKSERTDQLNECEAKLQTTTAPPPTSTTVITDPPPNMAKYRLPKEVVPLSYELTLKPNLESKLFTGSVKITVDVLKDVQEIILNSHTLTINSVKSGNTVLDNDLDIEYERLHIMRPNGFKIGQHEFVIDYTGNMTSKLVGLYHSTFQIKSGETKAIATTKFEPTYARQAYPCFDEPNLKATYKVHLLKPRGAGFIALSNMPQEGAEEDLGDEGILVSFETSKNMSTYLACFIVSTMEYTSTTFGPDNKQLRVYATPGQEAKTTYALQTAKTIMEFYLNYFGIEYPLPKLDMAAIPDFVSGAMENWGLVTYRETALLYDPTTSSEANRARIAEVVAHELAHSWFGNLVTMDWWDDLWLNEGFASYIEYKGVHAVHDDWQMMDQFLIADLHDVLVLDATTASHPIVQSADTPNQITAMFDTISYKKGASILRMLEDAITAEQFQKGVTNYLNNHLYGNAVTADFWAEMDKVSEDGIDIPAIMETWTTQMGYPVVTVTKSGTKYTLKQERYLTNSETGDKKADYKWTIPITYTTNKDPNVRKLQWFNKDQAQIEIDIPAAPWVKFNYHQTGYYRINYGEEEWKIFASALIDNHRQFDVSDRANLLEESFRLAESGHVPYTVPLELSKYLVEEDDFIVWTVADRVLTQLKKYLFNFASNENYQKYVEGLVKNIAEKLGWNEVVTEKSLTKRLRSVTLSLACSMGNIDCLEQAGDKFSKWLQTGANLPQNIRGIIYNYGIKRATKKEWHQVLEKYQTEGDANEKIRLMEGLSKVNDPELLQSLILFAQVRNNVRDQDYFSCMSLVSANPSGTALVWNYVRSYWPEIVDRFGLNERNLGRMIPQITKSFSSQVALDEMKAFFKKYPESGAGAAARLEAEETVKNNINWVQKYEKTVSEWLPTIP